MADQSTSLSVLAPEVRTLARPASGVLLAARSLIQRHEPLQQLFLQAKTESWDAPRLAAELASRLEALEGSPPEVQEVALYLADEFVQIGDGLLLICRETGRALARITDDDFWLPPKVARPDGMIQPAPRLRPELEAFLYQYIHEKAQEDSLQSELVQRTKQTAYLAQEGDRRLRVSTRAGRKAIAAEIQAQGANLFASVQNTTRGFLQLFLPEPTPEMELAVSGIALSLTQTHVSDALAVNYRYDHAGVQGATLTHRLTQELALAVATEAHRRKPPVSLSYMDVSRETLGGATCWVIDPALSGAFLRVSGITIFYVPGVRPTGFRSPAGAFAMMAGSFTVESRERFERWDLLGRFTYTVHLDWNAVETRTITDIPPSEPVVEVVR